MKLNKDLRQNNFVKNKQKSNKSINQHNLPSDIDLAINELEEEHEDSLN